MGGNLMALIIVPASLIFNWEEEIIKFCPKFSFYSLAGSTRHTQKNLLDQFDVVLTTYQTALRDISDLGKFSWQYIILDESHMIKNRESKIFKAVNQLNTVHKISLSGTPIENSLADLWSQMQFINPDILGTFSFFKKHFVLPIQQQQDEGALQQLRLMVEPFILRRRKQDVAKDLPEISSQIEYVPMTPAQEKMFEEEKSAARNYLLAISEETPDFTFHVLSSLLRLRQIANHPKLLDELSEVDSGKFNHVQEQINSVLASGHKVLIFSSFTSHLDLFSKVFDEYGRPYCLLTGKTSQKKRKEQVHLFQEDAKNQVFLISIKAGGTGLNLTRADYVFILDPWWNPFVEEQAIARAHRIGREQPISVIRFISKNSIEEKIILLQARKKILAAELIEGSEQVKLAKEDLRFLLE
jgi:non-specific serine/threonine protein kinase